MKTEEKETADDFLAVFNCRKVDITKAKKLFVKRFSLIIYKTNILHYVKNGIMEIFQLSPNKYTKYYVETLANIVRKRNNWNKS
jgi:hypothetical protein